MRRMLAVLLTMLVAAPALGACGDSGGSSNAAESSETARTEASTTAVPEPEPEPEPVALTLFPSGEAQIKQPEIRVNGRTAPGGVVTVTLRDAGSSERLRAGRDGRWSHTVNVLVGANTIDVSARAKDFATSTSSVYVERKRSAAELAEIRRRRAEAAAARVQAFKDSTETIPYSQLIKDPESFRGRKVRYYGQIFQIQQSGGVGFMLLSVTDGGYGFWDDNIWVNYEGNVRGAEEDMITVYGRMTGSESYETQAGGETYVPRMRALYWDE